MLHARSYIYLRRSSIDLSASLTVQLSRTPHARTQATLKEALYVIYVVALARAAAGAGISILFAFLFSPPPPPTCQTAFSSLTYMATARSLAHVVDGDLRSFTIQSTTIYVHTLLCSPWPSERIH